MIGSERGDVLFHVSRRGLVRGGFGGISSRTVLMDLIFNCLLASCFELGDDPPCLVWGGHSKSPKPTVSGGIPVGLGIIEKDDLPWLAADRAYCVIEALSTGFHRPHLMGEEDVVKALEQAGDLRPRETCPYSKPCTNAPSRQKLKDLIRRQTEPNEIYSL